MEILVVEDTRVAALVLQRILVGMGFQVTLTTNGAEAWEALQHKDFPVVISDWMMPEMDGIELCRRIRSRAAGSFSYIILLTARGTREDKQEAIEAGADDFLVKPLDAAELSTRLRVAQRILDMKRGLEMNAAQLRELHDKVAAQNEQLRMAIEVQEMARKRFSDLFEGLPVACFTYNEDGRIIEWNEAFAEMFGLQPDEIFEKSVWELMSPAGGREAMDRVFSGLRMEGVEWTRVLPDGGSRSLHTNAFPMRDPHGAVVGAICASIDITERRILEQRLEEQLRIATALNTELERNKLELEAANTKLSLRAVTDGLTGLKNHRHFQEVLEKRFIEAAQHDRPLSVIMLDVDYFKQYNDTYGHPAGDQVLKGLAEKLEHATRDSDVVARYGGEEFVALLPDTDAEEAVQVAERLRESIEAGPWPLRPITASIGVASRTGRMRSPSQLVDSADQALYWSKKHGRNRTTHVDRIPAECEVQPPIAA